MNDVYITAGGGRWHQRADCEALSQGQQDAERRGLPNHPVQQVVRQRVGSRSACGWCVKSDVPESAERSPTRYSALRTDTEYEQVFVDHVLEPLGELISWQVTSQESVLVGGRTYRVDFALHRSPWRIAIEIDGENKGPNAPSHDEWTLRQTSLVSAGWEVLRFTNRQVMHEQEYCRRQIAVVVARLQERGHHKEERPAPMPVSLPQRRAPSASEQHSQLPANRRVIAALALAVALAAAGATTVAMSGQGGDDAPATGDRYPCPASRPVKGNVSADGERIYHQRGDAFYDRTAAEQCFSDAASAEAAGFRATHR